MFGKPIVSVIVTSFNCEAFIGLTIQSVLSQSYDCFELIIVDDCSTDNTISIIESFLDADDRIVLLRNGKNCGAAFSRNRALSVSKGVFVAFLDGDDLWAPSKLEKQVDFMVTHHLDMSYTRYLEIDEQGSLTGKIISAPKHIGFKSLLRCDWIGFSTFAFRRSIYPEVQVPTTIKKRNDYALLLLLHAKSDKGSRLVAEPLTMYRKRNGSLSSGKKGKLFKYHVFLFENVLGKNKLTSLIFALRNVFYYFWKKMLFVKRVRK